MRRTTATREEDQGLPVKKSSTRHNAKTWNIDRFAKGQLRQHPEILPEKSANKCDQ